MDLDRSNPIPASQQLFVLILGQIERGTLRPGDRLPTEAQLCARYGISRTPVRNALTRLREMGLLVRQPGRGTFVSSVAVPGHAPAVIDLTVTAPDQRWCWSLQRAARLWNDEYPDRQIRVRFRIVEFPRLHGALMLAVAQGEAPDISLIDSVWVAEFAHRGYLRPIGEIDHHLADEFARDLLPAPLEQSSVGGTLAVLPAEADFSVLWYRRDWFAAESLAPPATWKEWIASIHYFQRAPVRARYGLGAHPLAFVVSAAVGETATYQLLTILWSSGADVISGGRVTLNGARAERAVSFVRDLVRTYRAVSEEAIHGSWNSPALSLAAGACAMAMGGSYEARLIRSAAGWSDEEFMQKVGIAPIPAGPRGEPATLVGGLSYAVYRQSRHPALALALIARAFQPDVLIEFCRRTGQNPPTRSATAMLDPERDAFLHATAQLMPYARSRWPLIEYIRVSQQLRRMFERVVRGEYSPDEAVAQAATAISGITGLPEPMRRAADNAALRVGPRS
jgi:ABC-type glycerol-3-phosphate transport system substrate-binding protein